MTGPETKQDWIVIKSISEEAIRKTLEYVKEIWSTEMWITNQNNTWILWAMCTEEVLASIKCKAIAFRDGWNVGHRNY